MVAVAVMVVVTATHTRDNLGTRDTLEAAMMVADLPNNSLGMAEVVMVPGGVVLAPEEVGLQQGRSFVSDAGRQVTSLLSVKKWW